MIRKTRLSQNLVSKRGSEVVSLHLESDELRHMEAAPIARIFLTHVMMAKHSTTARSGYHGANKPHPSVAIGEPPHASHLAI